MIAFWKPYLFQVYNRLGTSQERREFPPLMASIFTMTLSCPGMIHARKQCDARL